MFGFLPYTSDVLVNTTRAPCRWLNSNTLRVPITLTSTTRSGSSTYLLTPTTEARWNTLSTSG